MRVPSLEDSRQRLLGVVAGAADVTVCRLAGNLGDHLIDAGTEELLREVPHRTLWRTELAGATGDLLIVNGSGAFTRFWHRTGTATLAAAEGFERIVIFPSTYDVTSQAVREVLMTTRAAPLFARETRSLVSMMPLRPDVILAHDAAFFFDFSRWRGQQGHGTLYAFRGDKEAVRHSVPPGNRDISEACADLAEWLHAIAAAEEVHSDRAHVVIAAALLGKRVRWRPGRFYKVRALVDTWLGEYDVRRL